MGTQTPNLNLYRPSFHEVGWDDEVNANFDTIDNTIGLVRGSSSYASLQAAVSALGSTPATLSISTAFPATANTTVPRTLVLKFVPGGSLSVSTGVTVTINGPIDAAITQQIFSLSGTGVVEFGSGNIDTLYPQWWASKTLGDGTGDDSVAINAALTAARTLHEVGGGGGKAARVFLPSGQYRLTSALKMPPATRLSGESMYGSQLYPQSGINGIEILGTDWSGGFGFRNTVENMSIRMDGSGSNYYIKVDSAYELMFQNMFCWNTGQHGMFIKNANQVVLVGVDIDGVSTGSAGIGVDIQNSSVNAFGCIIEQFATHVTISKIGSLSTVGLFGCYIEQLANSIGVIFDNVFGCNLYGCQFINASGGTTPIGLEFKNGSHHNFMFGGNIGDPTQFAFTPCAKTDAASYQNRLTGVQYNGTINDGVLFDNAVNITTVAYASPLIFNCLLGSIFTSTITDGSGFTINAPTNANKGMQITVTLRNASGGVLGTATWNSIFKMGAAWTQPANGFSRSIDFHYNGTNWIETNRSAADVSN